MLRFARWFALVLQSSAFLLLGFFVMMAESGGKAPRPDVLALLVLALVCTWRVNPKSVAKRDAPWVAVMLVLAGVGAFSPLWIAGLFPHSSWATGFALGWFGCAVCAGLALFGARNDSVGIDETTSRKDSDTLAP